MKFVIRPYHPCDLVDLYNICLKTGDLGKDASTLCSDPNLFGHYYAAPYAVLEPDLCFILTGEGVPMGYILGTRDSIAFRERCEQEWFPLLRERYPMPDPEDESFQANIIRLIHIGRRIDEGLENYPAHLHIDLLPTAQGGGHGRQLINTFTEQLKLLQVPALHLQVARQNSGAVKFYERVGFHIIHESPTAIAYGMKF